MELTKETVFRKNEGLIGRVFASGIPEWLQDTGNADLFIRAKAVKVTGISDKRTVSVNEFNAHVHPDDREEAVKSFDALYQSHKSYSRESRFTGDDSIIGICSFFSLPDYGSFFCSIIHQGK